MGTAGCVTVSCSTLWGPSHPGGVEGGAPWEAGQPHKDPCGARMAASKMHPDLSGTVNSADATFSSQPELPRLGPESLRKKPPTRPHH